jgi:hypothetical protein
MANRFRTVRNLIKSKQKPYNAHKKEIEHTTRQKTGHSAQNDVHEPTSREPEASTDADNKHNQMLG